MKLKTVFYVSHGSYGLNFSYQGTTRAVSSLGGLLEKECADFPNDQHQVVAIIPNRDYVAVLEFLRAIEESRQKEQQEAQAPRPAGCPPARKELSKTYRQTD